MVNSRPSGEKSPTTVSKESDTAVILTTCPAPPSNCHHSADDSLNRPVAFERRFRASERRSLGSRTSSDGAPAPAVLSTLLTTLRRTNPSTEDAGHTCARNSVRRTVHVAQSLSHKPGRSRVVDFCLCRTAGFASVAPTTVPATGQTARRERDRPDRRLDRALRKLDRTPRRRDLDCRLDAPSASSSRSSTSEVGSEVGSK